MTDVVFVSPEAEKRRSLDVLKESIQEKREAREREAQRSYDQGEHATRAFLNRHVPGAEFAGAMERMAAADAEEEITRQRCVKIVERWLADGGGGVGALQELLGTRQAATRSAMLDSQARLRARFAEAEARKSELERLVERQGREISYLRSQVDRSFEVLAEQSTYRS